MGSEVVVTPGDVMAKATRMLKRVMALQMVWFLCFLAGGVLMIWTAWKNTHRPSSCPSGSAPLVACRGLRAPLVPLAGDPGAHRHRRAARDRVRGDTSRRQVPGRRGGGLLAERAQFMGPTGPRPGGGGFPDRTGGMPPRFDRGLPPSSSSPAPAASRCLRGVGSLWFKAGFGGSALSGSACRRVRRWSAPRRKPSRGLRRTSGHADCRPRPTRRPLGTCLR